MRTIGQHQDEIASLVAGALARRAADEPEQRSLDDLAATAGGASGRRVLAGAVTAPVPLPPFDNAQMDGFAVRVADAGRAVRVVAPVPAGVVPAPLAPGTAAPIMTGARIPDGADAVFPVETTEPGAFPAALHLDTVAVPDDLSAGTFVRATGSDLARGGELAVAGDPVTRRSSARSRPPGSTRSACSGPSGARRLHRLRAAGRGSRHHRRRERHRAPGGARRGRCGIPGGPRARRPGRVRRVGRRRRGGLGGPRAHHRRDQRRGVRGGAPGPRTARAPGDPRGDAAGGPQASGTVALGGRSVPVVSFPGNPVSALVSFEVFLRPVLAGAVGLPTSRPAVELPAADTATSPAGKHQSVVAGWPTAACTSSAARARTCSRTTPPPPTSSTSRSAPPPSNRATR